MNERRLEIAPEVAAPEERKSSFWGKLKRGLMMTHTEVLDRVEAALDGRVVFDAETLEHPEEGLIAADIGVQTALELVEQLRKDVKRNQAVDALRLRERLVDEMALLLLDAPAPPPRVAGAMVTLLVGVDGVGWGCGAAKLVYRA